MELRALAVQGNQAQAREGRHGVLTSTRNFPNAWAANTMCTWARRNGGNLLRAWAASRPRTLHGDVGVIRQWRGRFYRYMNFDQIQEYQELSDHRRVPDFSRWSV